MSSCQYEKFQCGDKTILRPSYLLNGISYTGKMTSLYWIGAWLEVVAPHIICDNGFMVCAVLLLALIFATYVRGVLYSSAWHGKITVSQIPQCTRTISHNAPVCNRRARLCTFRLRNGALWDIYLMHCGIREIGLLLHRITICETDFWWAVQILTINFIMKITILCIYEMYLGCCYWNRRFWSYFYS